MSRRVTGALATATVLLAVLAAAFVVATTGSGPQSLSARVNEVSLGLRCPTCEAESVAASNAPLARSMRSEVRDQLRAGKTPDQIRSWFEARYGPRVLLMPPARGMGILLWLVPIGALVLGVAAWVAAYRRRAVRSRRGDPVSAISPKRVGVAALAFVAVGAAVPAAVWASTPSQDATSDSTEAASGQGASMTASDWSSFGRSLDDQQRYGRAMRAYRRALHLSPGSAEVRTRLAFDLLRTDRPAKAEPLIEKTAHRPGPYRSLALLVLGLAQRQQGDPQATATLHQFLKLSPDHPAADQVRRLLKEGS